MIETFGSLLRALQQSQSQVLELAADRGVTGAQLSVLSAVVSRPGIDQRGVTAVTFVDKSTVANVVSKLVDRGLLVYSRNGDDARRGKLDPTGEATSLVYDVAPRLEEGNNAVLAELPRRKREALLRQLRRIAYADRQEPPEEYVIPSPDGNCPAQEVSWGLGRPLRACLQRYSKLWGEQFGTLITPIQYLVLKTLEEHCEIDQNRLGEAIALDKASLTEMLVRLQRRGLVVKRRDPMDARRRLLELTAPARVLLRGVDDRVPAVEAAFVSPLPPTQRPVFRDALRIATMANCPQGANT